MCVMCDVYTVFERWMEWEPDEQAWASYINMELRYNERDRARQIYERFVVVHPKVENWCARAAAAVPPSLGQESRRCGPLRRCGTHEWCVCVCVCVCVRVVQDQVRQVRGTGGGFAAEARSVYERATTFLARWRRRRRVGHIHTSLSLSVWCTQLRRAHACTQDFMHEKLYVAFAHFEEYNHEFERARVVYKYAIENSEGELQGERDTSDVGSAASRRASLAQDIREAYTKYEKRFGDKSGRRGCRARQAPSEVMKR